MTLRRSAAILLLLLGTGAPACSEQSRVGADAEITIGGQVRDTDGAPLGGRPVRLGSGIGTAQGVAAALTLGLACVDGACTGKVVTTTTDGDGRFELTLEGRQTQSSFGEALDQLLSVSAAPAAGQVSGASATAAFTVQTEHVRLPDLDLVDPHLVLDAAADVDLRWTTDAPGPYAVTFEADAPVPVWRTTTSASSATFDQRLLEDTAGRTVLGGLAQDEIEGSDVALTWRSPGVGYASAAGAPPSRGRPCHYVSATASIPSRDGACGLTDGSLTHAAATPAGATSAVVDLPRPLPAELVVVRGCTGGCAVDTTTDGTTWTPAGSAAAEFGTVDLTGAPITAVRVGLGTSPGSVREVSVWGPRTSRRALRHVDAESLRAPFGADAATSADRTLVGAIAGALAAIGLVSIGFVLGRRRSEG